MRLQGHVFGKLGVDITAATLTFGASLVPELSGVEYCDCTKSIVSEAREQLARTLMKSGLAQLPCEPRDERHVVTWEAWASDLARAREQNEDLRRAVNDFVEEVNETVGEARASMFVPKWAALAAAALSAAQLAKKGWRALRKPGPESLTPEEVARYVARLEAEGHGPQEHGGQVKAADHDARILRGIDPETGMPVRTKAGRLMRPQSSSSFRSDEAYAWADMKVRERPEFATQAATGKASFELDVALEDVLGPDYLRHVEGRTVIGAPLGSSRAVDFNGGRVRAIYVRNDAGGYDLLTMFPEGN